MQHLVVRPPGHVSFFEQDALRLIEIHLDETRFGADTCQAVQFTSRYLPLRLDEHQIYDKIDLFEICLEEENLYVKQTDCSFIQSGQDLHLEEGSFIKIYSGEDRQLSPMILDSSAEDQAMHEQIIGASSSNPSASSSTVETRSSQSRIPMGILKSI